MISSLKSFLTFSVLAATLFLSVGCSTLDSRTQKLSLGMTKEQSVSLLGKNYKTVGARETADARKTEVIRYDDAKYGELLLYFRDGKLVQWGDIRILDNMPETFH